MRLLRPLASLPAVLLCLASTVSQAVVSTAWQRPAVASLSPARMRVAKASRRHTESIGSRIYASLRQDVARHPQDFLIFATRTAANHFLRDHVADANRETEPRMIESGVMGYWNGKTLVVLPIVSSMLDGDASDAVTDKN